MLVHTAKCAGKNLPLGQLKTCWRSAIVRCGLGTDVAEYNFQYVFHQYGAHSSAAVGRSELNKVFFSGSP